MKKILTLIGLMIIVACSVMAMTACENTDWGEGDGDPSLLEFELSEDGTYYIVAGIGDYVGTHLVIPEEHNCLPVREINSGAFYCEADVDKPEEKINAMLGIKSVTLPDSMTKLGWTVFRGSNIEQLNIGSGASDFDESSFVFRMSKLKEINVSKDNQTYMSKDGVLYSKDGERLILYPVQKAGENFRIPNRVEVIAGGAFYTVPNLKKVKMGNRVIIIEGGAFAESSLEEIKIGNRVEVIEESAFRNCANLKKVTMGKSVKAIGENAFFETGIKEIKIGNAAETIGKSAFEGSANLQKVKIGKNVTTIGAYAFFKTGIEEIKIPDSVKSMGDYAFCSCKSLKKISIGKGLSEIPLGAFGDNESLKRVIIPKNITTITGHAFYMCENLTEIFYEGNDKQWNEVHLAERGTFGILQVVEYRPVFDKSATVYCYSKDKPSNEGNYWRYVFWSPTVWKN